MNGPVRIPGLDHSLLEDGSWLPDEQYYLLTDERERVRRATAKSERQRVRYQNSGQVCIGDDVATR